MTLFTLPALLTLLAPPAQAEWHLAAEMLTDVPVQVGGALRVEGPKGLRLGTSLGVMPQAYVDLINDTALAFEWYDEPTAKLIETIMQNSLVSRTHVGWAPFEGWGFYAELGYGFVGLSGAAVGSELLTEAAGLSVPSTSRGSDLEFDASAVLHMLDVEFGWQWAVWEEALWLRAAIGGAFTLSTSATVERKFEAPLGALWDEFEAGAEDYLVDTLSTYGHTGTLSIAAAYRFF